METSVQPQDDPKLRLDYYRETGQSELASQYEQYLKETRRIVPPPPHRPLTKPQIARLATSQAEKNAAEMSGGERLMAKLPEGTTKKFLGAAALPLQGLPGGEALQAKVGSMASGDDYRTALKTQRETTGRIGAGGQLALKAIGGVAGMAIPGAGSLLSSRLGQAALGASYGASDADADQTWLARTVRGVGGAVMAPLFGFGAEKLAGTNPAARAMGKFATMVKDEPSLMRVLGALTPQAARQTGRRIATPVATVGTKMALEGMAKWGAMTNAQRAAARRLSAAHIRDQKAGLAGPKDFSQDQGMPETLGVDVAGPHVIEEARGAVRSTPGREAVRSTFEAREARAIPKITEGVSDAMEQRYMLAQARKAKAQTEMEQAIEETTGIAVDLTPELQTALKTPVGKSAAKSAVRSRLNVPGRPLPEVPVKQSTRIEGYEPTEFIPPGQQKTEQGIDAEVLHLVSRALRRAAQAEQGQQKPMGKAASDAIAAGDIRSEVIGELPASFRKAMDNYRIASEEINALDLGRTKNPLNPTGLGKAEKSLTDVERTVGKMSPSNRAAFATGKQYDLASRLRGGQTVQSLAEEVAIPGGATQREAALSGAPFPERLSAWNRALNTQGSVLGNTGPARVRTGEGISMDVVAPTRGWAAVRALREVYGKMSDRARETQGANDAAFMNLLGWAAPQYRQALAAAKSPAERQRIIGMLFGGTEAQHKY